MATRRRLTDARIAVRLCGLSRQAHRYLSGHAALQALRDRADDRSALQSFDLAAKP